MLYKVVFSALKTTLSFLKTTFSRLKVLLRENMSKINEIRAFLTEI